MERGYTGSIDSRPFALLYFPMENDLDDAGWKHVLRRESAPPALDRSHRRQQPITCI